MGSKNYIHYLQTGVDVNQANLEALLEVEDATDLFEVTDAGDPERLRDPELGLPTGLPDLERPLS